MADETVQTQSEQAHVRVHELLSKYNIEDPGYTNPKRERFLAQLKSRFGYTNDKAVDELERLLKQFYRMNRSLGVHRIRPNFKHPHVG
jgi:hypothetical protein